MARYRPQEYCHKCGKALKAVHRDMGKGFIGDTFSHWEHEGDCEINDDLKLSKMGEFFSVDPGPQKQPQTIGEEFVEWAEQYWGLKRKYDSPEEEGSESCPYEYLKKTFANKIDEIISNRLSNKS